MTDFADYLEAALIDWAFGGSAFPAVPSDIYVALHTGAPGDDASSNEVSTADGYSRQPLANPGDWTQPNPNQGENSAIARFGPATADWGDVSHVSLWDAQTGGNPLFVGDLNTTRTVLAADEFELPSGEILAEVD